MDTTVKKVNARTSPRGELGEVHLVSGKQVAMRFWSLEPGEGVESERDYETVGYVLGGRAELELAGQKLVLEPGDSWLVPKSARHRYKILESFHAVEATAPPSHVHGRATPPAGSKS